MVALEVFHQWLKSPVIDDMTKSELKAIFDQPLEIEDRFYKHLDFGTGGIRGILGAGSNRVNRYTIRRITQGLANAILNLNESLKEKGVVIAYDSRSQSEELAIETANTLNANGIKALLFNSPTPTPLLSFSVRELGTIAGIVITASHNPPEYNGYKIYWEDGGQIVPSLASKIKKEIDLVEEIPSLALPETQGDNITWVGPEIEKAYISQLKNMGYQESKTELDLNLKIVYTPLHGTGGRIVKKILEKEGFNQVTFVPEQANPDPNFTTIKNPNPETKEAFQLALKLAKTNNAEIVLATDPDCDRVGVAVLTKKGEYTFLTGNQIGALLTHYLLTNLSKQNKMPPNPVIIKTIVTNQMGKTIASKYGVETIETLTGFKYIAEKINQFEQSRVKEFLFGYEESCGFLANSFVRDKDGVMATLLICQMAAFYKTKGETLYDTLQKLYQEHGFFYESLESRTIKGKEGVKKSQHIIDTWRHKKPKTIGQLKVQRICDYLKQESIDIESSIILPLDFPKENVLQFIFTDGSWFCIRPSGTEPKIKIYFAVKGITDSETKNKLTELIKHIMTEIDQML